MLRVSNLVDVNTSNFLMKFSFFQQFVSRLSAVRPSFTISSVQPIRFSSVQANSDAKSQNISNTEEQEPDKLYKRLELEIRGHDPMVMKSYVQFATAAANHLNIEVGRR